MNEIKMVWLGRVYTPRVGWNAGCLVMIEFANGERWQRPESEWKWPLEEMPFEVAYPSGGWQTQEWVMERIAPELTLHFDANGVRS